MLKFINGFNLTIFLLFTILYFYQIVYAFVALRREKNQREVIAQKLHRYAFIIAARNESAVIGQLIRSIHKQNYPQELIDVFVVADNCTDNTAEVACGEGAIVYERFNREQVGKGYALDYIFNIIEASYQDRGYEGFFVFDADNLLDESYVAEMNKVFDSGYRIITSYRNSKNYDSNWISAGYALWFLREAKYLNYPRMRLGTNCAISGTGFLVSSEIIRENHGWKYNLLTEDIEFSIANAIKGERIGYCGTAKIYDEQPCTFAQSWNQRLRWSKGFFQVFGRYGFTLFKTIFTQRSFSCFDMLMTIAPATFVSLFSIFVNAFILVSTLIAPTQSAQIIGITLGAIGAALINFYVVLFAFGVLTTITEWNEIQASTFKKILYTFTFPVFIYTYIPITIVALFKKIEWKPITHNICKSIDEIQQRT